LSKLFRVALLIESSRGYGRKLLTGIAAYARIFGPWAFFHEERMLGDSMPDALKAWRPHGIIVRMENAAMARSIFQHHLPTVDVLFEKPMRGIPGVMPHQGEIVRLTIKHLLERRLQHFAYCGFPGVAFSEERRRCFVRSLAVLGHTVDVFNYHPARGTKGLAEIEKDAMLHSQELVAWLQNLPKPVGLMACNDMRAYQVLSVCQEYGILVPEEVAVTGVDNDPVQCELCYPLLSSVDNNAERIGYEAAALLHQLMKNRRSVPRITVVEPTGMVVRRSTDLLAIADQEVVEIVRYARDHACEGLTPRQLVTHAAVSRSTLERWFTEHLGHSVNEELHRVRIERVKDLLITSDLSLGEISQLSGFAYAETMQRGFKNSLGQTPGEYRNKRRIIGVPTNTTLDCCPF
jgi:LacI family transcriptional regulator